MGGPRHQLLVPQLRGHAPSRVLESLRAAGWEVHQVGQAAYVHQGPDHFILGVWDRREPAPAWAPRLGRVSAGYLRRADRLERNPARTMARDAGGRFSIRLPWWRWTGVRVYSWMPAMPSLYELEQGRP